MCFGKFEDLQEGLVNIIALKKSSEKIRRSSEKKSGNIIDRFKSF